MKIAISGPNSGVGRELSSLCSSLGLEVLALGRGTADSPFDLSQQISLSIENVDAFVHLAWDWDADPLVSKRRNVDNLVPFLDKLQAGGKKMVLLSTDSVHARETSKYGAMKYLLEREFLARGGSVLRSGFLWGSQLGGILGTLGRISATPLVCAHIKPEPELNISNQTEVATELIALVSKSSPSQTVSVHAERKVALTDVLHALRGKRATFIHFTIWLRPIVAIATFIEKCRINMPFRADSLRALLPQGQNRGPELADQTIITKANTEEFWAWLREVRG